MISVQLKNLVKAAPGAGKLYGLLNKARRSHGKGFETSSKYWEQRYAVGGHSGAGSYGRLAQFKAGVLNEFVARNDIRSVLELGCGDGAQLALARYPSYVGTDVSPTVIATCRAKFADDPTKQFWLVPGSQLTAADITLSLDVIYHLVEDRIFDSYMNDLFGLADRFVCIYSSNVDRAWTSPHVRHRRFSDWIEARQPSWRLIHHVANPFAYDPNDPDHTSFADFHFYRRESEGL